MLNNISFKRFFIFYITAIVAVFVLFNGWSISRLDFWYPFILGYEQVPLVFSIITAVMFFIAFIPDNKHGMVNSFLVPIIAYLCVSFLANLLMLHRAIAITGFLTFFINSNLKGLTAVPLIAMLGYIRLKRPDYHVVLIMMAVCAAIYSISGTILASSWNGGTGLWTFLWPALIAFGLIGVAFRRFMVDTDRLDNFKKPDFKIKLITGIFICSIVYSFTLSMITRQSTLTYYLFPIFIFAVIRFFQGFKWARYFFMVVYGLNIFSVLLLSIPRFLQAKGHELAKPLFFMDIATLLIFIYVLKQLYTEKVRSYCSLKEKKGTGYFS